MKRIIVIGLTAEFGSSSSGATPGRELEAQAPDRLALEREEHTGRH